MKKKIQKAVSVILSLCFVLSVLIAAPVSTAKTANSNSAAQDFGEKVFDDFLAVLSRGVDTLADLLIGAIAAIVPQAPGCTKLADYVSENFYDGTDEFIDEASENASWSLGYSQRVLTPEDLLDRTYYMGGFDVNNVITGKHDDIKVRCVCLDDGSGRGKSIFAVIDAIGISNSDIRGIRETFTNQLDSTDDIASINVSVTHTHSGIDTQGIWAVFGEYASDSTNILKSFVPLLNREDPVSGVDKEFMQSIYELSAEAMLDAYNNMATGDLYYAEKDASEYFRYRQDPVNFIGEISRFRFDPYQDDVTPTIITNFGCHPETVGYGSSVMSADFIPYMEQVMNDAGYNFMFIQGAIGEMITSDRNLSSDGLELERYETAIRQGEEYAYMVLGMTYTEQQCIDYVVDHEREEADLAELGENADKYYTPWYKDWEPVDEEEIEPILNIAIEEIIVKIDNPVVKLIGKLGVTSNMLLKDFWGNFHLVTEVGYIEFGDNIKVLMSPGETNPEFIIGGSTMEAATSIHRKDFVYSPVKEYFSETDHVLVFDEMNDAAGYINPDNDYALALARYRDGAFAANTNALLFSLCTNMGSILIGTFLDIVNANK